MDTDKLKRLAEELKAAYEYDKRYYEPNRLNKKAYEAILALIAENERVKVERGNMQAVFNDTVGECDKLSTERDEAVALLREIGVFSGDVDLVSAFLARIDNETSK